MKEEVFWKNRIRRTYASLRPSEQQVADYLLENTEIENLTMKELAMRVGVSEPTVMRCMKAIGFSGYRSFKRALSSKEPVEEKNTSFDLMAGFSLKPWEKLTDLPFKSVQIQKRLLEQSLKSISPEDLEKAAWHLSKARTIDIYGVENSFSPAVDFLTKLTYLGLNCRMHTDAYLQQIAATHLTGDDVAIAFSHSGSSADTVKALKVARRAGALTIAVSSRKDAVISKYADVFLCIGGDVCGIYGNAIFSRVTDLFAVDLLYMSIILSDYERFSHNLDQSGKVAAEREYMDI